MHEVMANADRITVLRDGKSIDTLLRTDTDEAQLTHLMVGRELSDYYPVRNARIGDIVFEAKHLSGGNLIKDVNWSVRAGEVLGIGGLVGAQRTELVESIFGLRPIKSGTIKIDGKAVTIKDPSSAMDNHIALLTEDRKGSGLFPVLGVGENIYVASYKRLAKGPLGYIDAKVCKKLADESIVKLNVKTPTAKTPINSLSGGNQQKALLARWLLTEPDILLLDEPTRGIDVGAKYEIYKLIDDLAAQGKAVIVISSEMPELMGMADRIMVMCEGKLAGFVEGEEMQEENIMRLATKFMV